MDPISFLLGGLVVAVKGLAIGAVGFGIAWWRARGRIRQLEAEVLDQAAEIDQLTAAQAELQRRLPPSE